MQCNYLIQLTQHQEREKAVSITINYSYGQCKTHTHDKCYAVTTTASVFSDNKIKYLQKVKPGSLSVQPH